MRHEEATDAIYKLWGWYGDRKGQDVDSQLGRLIGLLLEADLIATRLHDNADSNSVRESSVDLLWGVVKACDVDAIRRAVEQARGETGALDERLAAKYE